MHSVSVIGASLLSILALSSASPLKRAYNPFPLSDGFPNPSPQQLAKTQKTAAGTLPNGPPPPKLSDQGVLNLQVIAVNELFEVAYFNELLSNITNNVEGYHIEDKSAREVMINTITNVRAQEELHALNANTALKHFGHEPLQPCQYSFPVSDLDNAIALASTFTDLVLGTLQEINQIFAENGDAGLIPGVSSVIGQEGEQNGYYRVLLSRLPSQLPFLTTSTRDFAANALNQNFIVPGSCPNINTVKGLKTFEPLKVVCEPGTKDGKIQLSYVTTSSTPAVEDLQLVLINQQNVPVVGNLTTLKTEGNTVTVESDWPYTKYLLNGLTISAITPKKIDTSSAQAVANSTLFGPGLIVVS